MFRNIAVAKVIVKISIVVFLVIGTAELVTGILSGSIALTADAFHTYSDAIISIVTLLGLKFSERTPDGRFHFGYYRAETLSAAISALVMIAIGVVILYRSITGIEVAGELKAPVLALIVASIATTSLFSMGLKKRVLATKFHSRSLYVDAYNTLKSGLASLMAFIGISLSFIGFYKMDPIAGIIIAGFIFAIGYKTVKEASLMLIDACMCEDILEVVKETAKSVHGVKDVRELKLRNAGPFVMGEMYLDLDGSMSVREAHGIVVKVRNAIKEKISHLVRLTIQIEPAEEFSS